MRDLSESGKAPQPGFPPASAQPAQEAARPATGGRLRIASAQLFAGGNEIEIDHNGTSYRLRQTSLGKLILTK